MSDFFSEFSEDFRKRRIQAPGSFADDVLQKITLEKAGGFKAMPASSRILLFAVVFLVYSSLGILLGVQSYRNLKPGDGSSSKEALVELMDTHHLNPHNMHDQLFRSLNSIN